MSTAITAQPVSTVLLASALSAPRLEAYRLHPADTARNLVGRYRWNVALCGALYPTLHYLEVIFRNRVHQALTAHCRTAAWYDVVPAWLHPREQVKLADASRELHERGVPLEPDRMVAELSFGFWTSLLSGFYAQVLWQKRTVIRSVFPFLPNRLRHRHYVNKRLSQIRHFRNRVFHQEPIWNSGNLLQRYQELRQTIDWFEPEVGHLLPTPDRFEEIHAQGPSAYELEVR